MTDLDIKNLFDKYRLKGLDGQLATVEKVNSSYKLDEYEKQKNLVQVLKNKVKIQAGKEATALRKQFTKQKTEIDEKESPSDIVEKSSLKITNDDKINPMSTHTPAIHSSKADMTPTDVSPEYMKQIHMLNEESKKVNNQ